MTTLALDAPGMHLVDDEWVCTPVTLGPTWTRNPDWDGASPLGEFILPDLTLGWEILLWIRQNLLDDEGLPFKPTREQTRFILWWYAIDLHGRFAYREGILQRLKGWGKDPLAAVLSAVEFVGPCRFAGWATEDMPDKGLKKGDPVAKSHPRAWVQIAAVSKDQTRNTMTLFPGLFTKACQDEHGIDLGKEVIYAYHGARRIEAVTSSPRALEGGRPTFVIKNETHHWLLNNEGHAMSAVIERNSTKSKDGAARTLSITNAYEPSEGSVAQIEREAWEDEESGLSMRTGVLYDSVEAPPDARMRPPKHDDGTEVSDEEIKAYLGAIIRAVRGDADWLDVDRTVASILDRKNPPSRSRRFWFNQVVASEDAWADPDAVDKAFNEIVRAERMRSRADELRTGWLFVVSEEPVVMFLDCSKSDDSTALVGCRLSDGYLFTLGVWQKPPEDQLKGAKWLAPREKVDARVHEAMIRFNVVAFWGDPSHAKDDEDSSRYWDAYFDKWMRLYREDDEQGRWKGLDPAHWPLKSGHNTHAIMFDMVSPERQKLFVGAAEEFIEALETRDDIEEFDPQFTHDGHPALVKHLKNARQNPGPWGTSLMKEGRESSKKIDLAVCAVGARMLRRIVLNKGVEEEEETSSEVWGAW